MFLFNRSVSSSQHSCRTSRDSVQVLQSPQSQGTPSLRPTTSSEKWSPQLRRTDTEGAKRISVFGSRQRSNTIASSSSFSSTASSTPVTGKRWWRGSRDTHSTTSSMYSPGERSESMAKTLLSRSGRMLKRQNSTLTSLRTLDEDDTSHRRIDVHEVQELSGGAYMRHDRTQSIESETMIKRIISAPYNFQHLTHANAKHLPEIHRATQHELVTEFSAIRASQAPRRELRGIKAENLHFRNFSSEALQREPSSPDSADPITPPPLSPTRSTEFMRRESPSPLGARKGTRPTRSVENFSLPSPRSPRSPFSPVVPPPRTSSRAAATITSNHSLVYLESPTAPEFGGTLSRSATLSPDIIDSGTSLLPREPPISTDDAAHNLILPHAVSTPDDSALLLLPLPFGTPGTELADVPEEDEDYFRRRASVRSSRPSTAGSALRHAQSFPSTKSPSAHRPTSHHPLRELSDAQGQQQRPTSSSSNVLTSTFRWEVPANTVRPAMPSRRVSRNLNGIEGCWEDAIDYCYQHAAEADCEYDWDRRSRDGGEDEGFSTNPHGCSYRTTESFLQNHCLDNDAAQAGSTRNTMFVEDVQRSPFTFRSSDVTMPELEPCSAISESTSGAGPLTPSLALLPPPSIAVSIPAYKAKGGFGHSPSSMTLQDYDAQMLEETMYQELLGDATNSDQHYPFYNQGEEGSRSRTDSPLSKCTSLESMIVSRAASAQQNHRSTHSSGSLPELVHSKNSRERFEIVADELAEHIASLGTTELPVDTQRSISPLHKRTVSLAKEVAHQSMLKKATGSFDTENDEVPAPLIQSTRRRDRSCSDEPVKGTPSTSNVTTKRLRSSSSATAASSRRSSRVSYTLFPTSTIRSTS